MGHAPKRPRRAVEARLLAQLSRLESVVKRMEQQSPDATSSTASQPLSEGRDSKIEQKCDRLVIDEMHSCYVSSVPWSQLGDEIEELRDLLHQASSEDEKEPSTREAEGAGPNSALLGYRALAHSLQPFHPPVHQAVALFNTFKANVNPSNIEALLFAIYYAAVISLESSQCLDLMGLPRSSALETYRFAVEQATARADLLNTQNLILLQATVLFLTALRNEDDSRTVWSLTSLVYHIAQAMGLHHDGQEFGLRPSCEDAFAAFDTQMPLNINNTDLTAEMTEPPGEREGVMEMTFCLMRCHAMRVVWELGYMASCKRFRSAAADTHLGAANQESLVNELESLLQDRYLKYCNTRIPFPRLTVSVARIITLQQWMTILSPRCQTDRTIRERLFNITVEILQLLNDMLTSEEMRQGAWHSKTHLQCYSIAFLLAELCRRPPSPECDHAWNCVTAVYERWQGMETDKRTAVAVDSAAHGKGKICKRGSDDFVQS
ncbi:hypothetical protein BDW67DRAFT_188618 [Aspergillus spinulosporus]